MLAIEISDDISVKSLTTVKLKLAKKKKKKGDQTTYKHLKLNKTTPQVNLWVMLF